MLVPLDNFKTQISTKIVEINSDDFSVKLAELGILPGVELSVQNRAPFKGPLSLLVNGSKVMIRYAEASFILVEAV